MYGRHHDIMGTDFLTYLRGTVVSTARVHIMGEGSNIMIHSAAYRHASWIFFSEIKAVWLAAR